MGKFQKSSYAKHSSKNRSTLFPTKSRPEKNIRQNSRTFFQFVFFKESHKISGKTTGEKC
jgi:hypothetical protein